jgi:hypothetical protein
MPTVTTSIQYSIAISSQNNKQKKEIKGIQIGMKEIKLSLLIDNITFNIENLKGATKKVEIINLVKLEDIKSILKSVVFLYINNELS